MLIVVHYQVVIFFLQFLNLFIPVITHFLITCDPFYVHKNKFFFNYLFTSFYVFFYFVYVNDTINQFLRVVQLHSILIIEFIWSHLWFLNKFPDLKNRSLLIDLFSCLPFTLDSKFEIYKNEIKKIIITRGK